MKHFSLLLVAAYFCVGLPLNNVSAITLHLILTSDIHGWMSTKYIYPKRKAKGLLHIAGAMEEIRKKHPDLILLDSGDLLSGSPLSFYFNQIQENPLRNNIFFNLINNLQYDAITVGNHDLDIYTKLVSDYLPQAKFTWLGANFKIKNSLIFAPYLILERKGLSVAVLGLTTPGALMWGRLSHNRSVSIESIKLSVLKWLSIIQEQEHPDLIIGLFHVGLNSLRDNENSKLNRIPAANNLREVLKDDIKFDLVVSGHDHRLNPYRSDQEVRYVHNTPVVSAGNGGEGFLKLDLKLAQSSKKWAIHHIKAQVIKSDDSKHLTLEYLNTLPSSYKTFIQSKLPWRIEKTTNKQASLCFNQLLAKAHEDDQTQGSLFPVTQIKGIRQRFGKYMRRLDLFRWFRYHNLPVTMRMSIRDIQLLSNPQTEYGKRKVSYNRKLFLWTKNKLSNGFDAYWWPNSHDFDRRYRIKVSNYHAAGGGGVVSGAFFMKEDYINDSPFFFKERLFDYLDNRKELFSNPCQFLIRDERTP